MTSTGGGNAVIRSLSPAFKDLAVSISRIESNLGYAESPAPRPAGDRLGELLESCVDITGIECGFVLFPSEAVVVHEDCIEVEACKLATGGIIAGHFRNAETIAVFAATAGRRFDSWLRSRARENDPLDYFLADAIGAELAERAADWLEDKLLAEVASAGFSIGNRHSPGYCNWPVSDQKCLFSLMPRGFCGIELTESSMMLPVKSVSGIMGVGAELAQQKYDCGHCEDSVCLRRRSAGTAQRGLREDVPFEG